MIAMAMKRYQLKRRIIEAHPADGVVMPTHDTLAVTLQFDQRMNEVWLALLWAANRGNFGPFSAADLLPILAAIGVTAPAPTVDRIRPRLRRLVEMGLIVEA